MNVDNAPYLLSCITITQTNAPGMAAGAGDGSAVLVRDDRERVGVAERVGPAAAGYFVFCAGRVSRCVEQGSRPAPRVEGAEVGSGLDQRDAMARIVSQPRCNDAARGASADHDGVHGRFPLRPRCLGAVPLQNL